MLPGLDGWQLVSFQRNLDFFDFLLSRMRHALEQLSGWLLQAAQEGRDAVNALRTPNIEANSLTAALKRALED